MSLNNTERPRNRIEIDGRIVSEVKLRKTTKKSISVMNLRIAHNDPMQKIPVYVDIEVWSQEAEKLAETAKRGSFIVVYGQLRRDKWEEEKTNEPRSKLKITANRIDIEDSRVSREPTNISF